MPREKRALMSHWPKSSRREAGRARVADGDDGEFRGMGVREPLLDYDLPECFCGSRATPLPLKRCSE